MNQVLRSGLVAFSLLVIACGGSTPPPNDSSDTKKESSGNTESSSSDAALEAERKEFVAECNSDSKLDAFCQCSWEVVVKTTTAEERKDPNNPNAKKALESLPTECGDKLPAEMVKQKYVQACSVMPAMKSFCECSYTFLEKKGLLRSNAEAIAAVQGEMKTACAKELGEFGRVAFVEGCSKNHTDKVCQCAIDSLSKKHGDKLWALLESGSDEAKQSVRNATSTCGAK